MLTQIFTAKIVPPINEVAFSAYARLEQPEVAAEPVAEGGYGAALLLDSWALLGRPDLRAVQNALRLWIGAAGLVRPADEGGRVFLSADSGSAVAQALVR